MTQVNLAAIKLETLDAGGTIGIAAQKLETLSSTNPTIQIAAQKLETLVHIAPSIDLAAFKLETLLRIMPDPIIVPPKPPTPNTFRPTTPIPVPCNPAPRSRFRRFWATQPNACPPDIGQCTWLDPRAQDGCQRPGLVLLTTVDPSWKQLAPAYDGGGGLPGCGPPITGGTIDTENYVQGLALNILGTNAAQAPTFCGTIPGQRLGYWLDDITGNKSGSSVRYIPTKGFTISQSVQFVQMQANADMQKLVKYGVANSVTVTAVYIGNSTIGLKIIIEGTDDTKTVVNGTMTKLTNAWVWNT